MIRRMLALLFILVVASWPPFQSAPQAGPPINISIERTGCNQAHVTWTQTSDYNYIQVIRYSPIVAHGGIVVFDSEEDDPLTPTIERSLFDRSAVTGEYYLLQELWYVPNEAPVMQRYILGVVPGSCVALPIVSRW